jgi:hypothetical protein
VRDHGWITSSIAAPVVNGSTIHAARAVHTTGRLR